MNWSFLIGIGLGGLAVFLILHSLWHLHFFSLYGILNLLRRGELQEAQRPRSLRSCESMVLPQILKDFPDFDLPARKEQVTGYLREHCRSRTEFQIHQLALSDYRRNMKTVLFQAAVSWKQGELTQKRLELSMIPRESELPNGTALNCPNCGAVLGYGDRQCSYCGTRVLDAPKRNWQITDVKET